MLATIAMLLFPALALAQDAPPAATAAGAGNAAPGGPGGDGQTDPGPAPAKIKLKLKGLKGGKAKVGDRVEVVGHRERRSSPTRRSRSASAPVATRSRSATRYVRQVKGKNFGRVKLRSKPLLEPGHYRARASKPATAQQAGGLAKSGKFGIKYIDLDPGDRGPAVELFNDLLRKEGYYDTDKHNYGSHTERAVMAFRKVNGMERNFNANPTIFKLLAEGKGAFKPKYPGAGKHVEVDISKQVMVARQGRRAQSTPSTSRPARRRRRPTRAATPSIARTRATTRSGCTTRSITTAARRPTATHDVPPYPASHGCIRNPIPDSIFIYNWIDLGRQDVRLSA